MTHVMPWYMDICNFLIASMYPIGESKVFRERLESDAKYYIWDDPYLWRLCNDQVTRSRSSTFVTQQLKEATVDQCGQPKKLLTMGYTSPPHSKMRTDSSQPANNVKEPEWL
ncbi:hypothetical protein CR513_25974, partial [Mucuna pruriens]